VLNGTVIGDFYDCQSFVRKLPWPVGRVAQSVWRLATGWTVRDRNPVVTRFSAPVQTGPGSHPASCTMGPRVFPRSKSGRGVTLTPHRFLVPWSRNSRAIPLLPLWAARPVQSLRASLSPYPTFAYYPSFSRGVGRPRNACQNITWQCLSSNRWLPKS